MNPSHLSRRHGLLRLLPLLGLAVFLPTTQAARANAELAAAPASEAGNTGLRGGQDIHSHARPQEAIVERLSLDLDVDFTSRTLAGTASWQIVNRTGTDTLWLDARDLTIEAVTRDGEATTWTLGPSAPFVGNGLAIAITPTTRTVTIRYRSSPGAAALQWLEPAQTAGGKAPFLFSQSQAILARSWVPCQDTPGVRFSYDATLRVPPGLLALMSAENSPVKRADGVYRFAMPQPIPSYLLAIAVGDLGFQALDERSGVYAEPGVVAAAAAEFRDLPAMMTATEALYGPYHWGRYDLLVLPPSFPFGGMENPRLTFLTPTILAGDRSLVSLVAHELAHSWSGNLVTNSTWNDFWLNEGFTTYLERRIMEAIAGREYSEMLTGIGLGDLRSTLAELPPDSRLGHLRLDLTGMDPDEGGSDVAYEKGSLFLRLLEEAVGRTAFDRFLAAWFAEHAFQSVTTDDFLAFLDARLLAADPGLKTKIDLAAWIDGPGIPANAPRVVDTRFAKVEAAAAAWSAGKPAGELATSGWSSHEWIHFLRVLPATLSSAQLAELDQTFGFTTSGNSEIHFAWLEHVIAHQYQPAYPALERFLLRVGRTKFIGPLYRAMAAQPATLAMARDIFERARAGYHPLTQGAVDAILAAAKD